MTASTVSATSTSNPTHRKRLAKTLAERTGAPYATCLQTVRRAADAGLLPAPLNSTGMQRALTVLIGLVQNAHVAAGETASARPGSPFGLVWPQHSALPPHSTATVGDAELTGRTPTQLAALLNQLAFDVTLYDRFGVQVEGMLLRPVAAAHAVATYLFISAGDIDGPAEGYLSMLGGQVVCRPRLVGDEQLDDPREHHTFTFDPDWATPASQCANTVEVSFYDDGNLAEQVVSGPQASQIQRDMRAALTVWLDEDRHTADDRLSLYGAASSAGRDVLAAADLAGAASGSWKPRTAFIKLVPQVVLPGHPNWVDGAAPTIVVGSVRCPVRSVAADGTLLEIVGCGSANVRQDDSEPHLYDCLDCGIWFDPTLESQQQR